jgi:hypothetical protein
MLTFENISHQLDEENDESGQLINLDIGMHISIRRSKPK